MNKAPTLTILLILALFAYFIFQKINLPNHTDDSNEKASLSDHATMEDADLKIAPLILDNQTITFPHTDDNTNESIIIKSDKDLYTSFAGSDVYFSITNTSDIEEDGILLFHFDQNFKKAAGDPSGIEKPRVQSLEQREDNKWLKQKLVHNNISINSTKLAQALEKKKDIPETFDVSAGTQFKLAPHQTTYFKAKIAYSPRSEGEFWIETLGENGGYGLLDPWYASTYTHRKQITIDNAMVSGGADLSNFPVLIDISGQDDFSIKGVDFGGKVASGSGEFVFTSSDGTTKLDHEIEYYNLASGRIVAWVEVPTLATATDTILYLYFGGPTSGATNQNPTGVWDVNYIGVWHLKETAVDEGTVSSLYQDSTSNNKDGTQAGPVSVTGKIGIAQDFDNSNDNINIGDYDSIDNATQLSICAWVKNNTSTNDNWIFDKYDGITGIRLLRDDVGLDSGRTDTYKIIVDDGDRVLIEGATNASLANAWTYVCQIFVASSSTGLRLYVNGVEDANSPANASLVSSANSGTAVARIGTQTNGSSDPFNGQIDEVRISDIARSAGWIATEYNNQNSPSTYVTASGAEKEIRTAPDVKFKGTGVKVRGVVEIK